MEFSKRNAAQKPSNRIASHDPQWQNHRKMVNFRKYFVKAMDKKYVPSFRLLHWKSFALTWPFFKAGIVDEEQLELIFDEIEKDIEAFKVLNDSEEKNEDIDENKNDKLNKFLSNKESKKLTVKEQIEYYKSHQIKVSENSSMKTELIRMVNDPMMVHREIREKCPDLYQHAKRV